MEGQKRRDYELPSDEASRWFKPMLADSVLACSSARVAITASEAERVKTKPAKRNTSASLSTHRQAELESHGDQVMVYKGVAALVKLMNSQPGVVTFNSCQGGGGEHSAYVQFGGDGAFFLLAPPGSRNFAGRRNMGHENISTNAWAAGACPLSFR